MDVRSLKAFCARFPGATSVTHGPPSNVLVYAVGGKQFAYFKLSDPEKWRFSIRTTPERFLELTDIPGIKPARYMAKFHWVSIVDPKAIPVAYLKELITWSYDKAVISLPKARQPELKG